MKFQFPIFLLITTSLSHLIHAENAGSKQVSEDARTLAVMTFNIRYDNPNDRNPWKDRKGEVAQVIQTADVVGLQEAKKHQIDQLVPNLKGYAWFGVGRDDGQNSGEHTCIFYRKDRIQLIEQDTFWLSETPAKPGSRSWDSSLPRIVTWGKLRDKVSCKEFYAFNTHFDHRGQVARQESAKLIVERVGEVAEGSPVIVMGDFNTRENSVPYNTLVGSLKDARYLSGKPTIGPRVTTTSWTELKDRPSPIDYIFVNPLVNILQAENVGTTFRELYPSDHLPVIALITFTE